MLFVELYDGAEVMWTDAEGNWPQKVVVPEVAEARTWLETEANVYQGQKIGLINYKTVMDKTEVGKRVNSYLSAQSQQRQESLSQMEAPLCELRKEYDRKDTNK